MRRAIPFLAAAALAAAPPAASAARGAEVTIRDIEFTPATVHIHRGDRVRWIWRDGVTPHDVTSRGRRRFRSSQTKASGSPRVRFRRRGTYRYVCTIHPGMSGKVVVR